MPAWGPLALVVVCAAAGVFSLWYWGVPSGEHVQRQVEKKKSKEFREQVSAELDPLTAKAIAYIEAVRDCDCEELVGRTAWMQERLANLAATATEAELREERQALCDRVCARDDKGYRLVQEGVRDQYLFFPGMTYKFIGKDSGRDDLAAPVATRAWVEVKFTSPMRCLKDVGGRTISGLTVGINLSADGKVLKAGVLGNAEIQYDSLRYSW